MDSQKDRKNYQKLSSSPISSRAIQGAFNSAEKASQKKIIPTNAISGVREDLKKIFLPLLIDIFELRQMVDSYKTSRTDPHLFNLKKPSKTPKEILERLKQIQSDVEESERWCEGVIMQIAKGIADTREVLAFLEEKPEEPQSFFVQAKNLLKKLMRIKDE